MGEVNTRVDKYGYLTFTTPILNNVDLNVEEAERSSFSFVHPSDNIPLSGKKLENAKCTFIMSDTFFACNCKKNKDGTRNLILSGKDLHAKIGRRFENWDVPYLTIFLTKNTNVTKLNLAFNKIDSAGFISLIDYLTTHDHIIELDLRNNRVGDPGIRYMYHKEDQLKLQVLRLSGNKIGVKSSKVVAMTIAKNTSIKHLDVAEIDQTEASLVYFATVLRSDQQRFNETLKILDLSRPIPNCKYSKFNSSHIATVIGSMLQYNKTLEELHLQKFNFSCHDIEEMFFNATHNRSLKLLDLSCNNIGDFGTKFISTWLEQRPSLKALFLGHNIITNRGIRELSKGIKVSKLVKIDLSYNCFDDEGGVELLSSFRKSPIVNQFQIFGNNMGHKTAKIVERLLLSKFVNQENIDVKPYEVDGALYLAYYNSF